MDRGNVTLKPANPDAVLYTLEMTFTLGEWRSFKEALGTNMNWPVRECRDKIVDAIYQAEKQFYGKPGKDGE